MHITLHNVWWPSCFRLVPFPDILASCDTLCRCSLLLSSSPRSLALSLSAVVVAGCCRTTDWMSELNFHCTDVVPTRDIVFVPSFSRGSFFSRVLLSWFARFSFIVSGVMLSSSLFVSVVLLTICSSRSHIVASIFFRVFVPVASWYCSSHIIVIEIFPFVYSDYVITSIRYNRIILIAHLYK